MNWWDTWVLPFNSRKYISLLAIYVYLFTSRYTGFSIDLYLSVLLWSVMRDVWTAWQQRAESNMKFLWILYIKWIISNKYRNFTFQQINFDFLKYKWRDDSWRVCLTSPLLSPQVRKIRVHNFKDRSIMSVSRSHSHILPCSWHLIIHYHQRLPQQQPQSQALEGIYRIITHHLQLTWWFRLRHYRIHHPRRRVNEMIIYFQFLYVPELRKGERY